MGSKSNGKKNYFIPFEVTNRTVITPEYANAPVCMLKIGNRMVRGILIPASKDSYDAYLQPEWREDKRKQRHAWQESSIEEIKDNYELEPAADFNLEETVIKEEVLQALHKELARLKDIVDRTILEMFSHGYSEAEIGRVVGLSQKAVNKRKHNLFDSLYERLKDYQ